MILAPRYLPRLAATVGLFTRYGLRDFARQQGLLELSPGQAGEDVAPEDMAERASGFRKRLVELGPAYVKLGQVLSTRPDLLPEPFIQELQRLQDDVGPIPFADVEATIEEELGGRISKLFADFEHEPLASASLGQVHGAVLRDGRPVVVKVQRPGIRPQLAEDEGWDDAEVEAIRRLLGRPNTPDASAPEPEAAPASEVPSAEMPADTAPAMPRPPQRHAMSSMSDPQWLRGRRGPAATAYRRLRRLFPG